MTSFTNIQPLIFSLLLLGLFSCTSAPEGKKVEAGDAKDIASNTTVGDAMYVDTALSLIAWEATKPGDEGHNGSLKIKSGKVFMKENQLVGGNFVIDMNSINVKDLEGKKKAELESHLKTGDFFETGKYPEAEFSITEVSPDSGSNYTITGNLRMKDSTKSIIIPAMITMENGKMEAKTPDFTIDRTEWGIVYRSSFVNTLKDKLINHRIGLRIKLVAREEMISEEEVI